jgi:hypothetical protein
MTPQQEWAGKLADRIEDAGAGVRPPRHVLARLAALAFPAEVEYLDVDFVPAGATVAGHIALFTEHVVVFATFDDVKPMNMAPGDPSAHQDSTVSVQVVPRAALTRIELAPFQEGDLPRNSSAEWQNTDQVFSWPWAARVGLHYAGLPGVITAPCGRNASEFEKFLPSLVRDLDR